VKLPIKVHHARLGGEEFRVIRPGAIPPNAVLFDHDRWLDLYVDEVAASAVGGLWLLAARSPRSLIHLPLRANPWPFDETRAGYGGKLDLVLLHHSLQFAPSRWKELRRKLDTGRPETASLPEAAHAQPDLEHRHHRENHDLFHQHLHAETLFMTGSANVFRATARRFFDVAQRGPEATSHYCERFHSGNGVLGGDAREITVEYATPWA
jgi:hypothetical protein